MKKEKRKLSLAIGFVASSLAVTVPAFAEGEVVFASWGGSFQDALRSAMLRSKKIRQTGFKMCARR